MARLSDVCGGRGVLCKATEGDVKAFEKARDKIEKETGRQQDDDYGGMSTDAYVMAKPKMKMPRGMYGANAGATILVPKDSYEIEGGSHNTICHMSSGRCGI